MNTIVYATIPFLKHLSVLEKLRKILRFTNFLLGFIFGSTEVVQKKKLTEILRFTNFLLGFIFGSTEVLREVLFLFNLPSYFHTDRLCDDEVLESLYDIPPWLCP